MPSLITVSRWAIGHVDELGPAIDAAVKLFDGAAGFAEPAKRNLFCDGGSEFFQAIKPILFDFPLEDSFAAASDYDRELSSTEAMAAGKGIDPERWRKLLEILMAILPLLVK